MPNEDYVVGDTSKIMETIHKYGVAIVPNVLNGDEIESMNEGMWIYLETITDGLIDRNDNSTWKHYYDLLPNHSMLLQHWKIGHWQSIWDIRQNPKVCDVFSKIWDVPKEELLVSFDGASFHIPPEIMNRGHFRGKTWFHTDQRYSFNDLDCIQSWVTGYDVNKGDATLAFLEGSHKYHGEFAERFHKEKENKNWYKLENQDQHDFYMKEKGCEACLIQCPAGSMVLWDSRTIHCGQEPSKTRDTPQFRNVAYICMTPRSRCSRANIEKKKKAFNEMRMTSHWPHKPTLFGKVPQTYGRPLPTICDINNPILTELGRKLAGF